MEEYQPQNSPEQGNGSGNNDDFSQRKAVCAVAYLFGILFFLPLILYPNDAFGKFHANQSLVLLIVSVCGSVVFWCAGLTGPGSLTTCALLWAPMRRWTPFSTR